MKLEGKNVVVTGGAGFIGSHLCDWIALEKPKRLIVIDDFSLGKGSNLSQLKKHDWFDIYGVNAADYNYMLQLYSSMDVDVTFNLAVIPLPASLEHPKHVIDTNIKITSTLCELLRKEYYDTLIHVSSSEAYGTAIYASMNEAHPTKPITPYAASKLACDNIVLSYSRTFGVDVAIARPFNNYGPRQNEGSYAGVIPLTIKRILTGQFPVIHGDGQQTRDFSYVGDISEAILKIYETPKTRGRVVNLASGKEISIEALIYRIRELMHDQSPIISTEPRVGDLRRHLGDITLAKKLIGYKPKTSYEEGLRKTIEWYRND